MSEWGKECNIDTSFRIFTREYMKKYSKDISGTDRASILKTCTHLIRWRDLLDCCDGSISGVGGSWRTRYYTYTRFGGSKLLNFDRKGVPKHVLLGKENIFFLLY